MNNQIKMKLKNKKEKVANEKFSGALEYCDRYIEPTSRKLNKGGATKMAYHQDDEAPPRGRDTYSNNDKKKEKNYIPELANKEICFDHDAQSPHTPSCSLRKVQETLTLQ